MIRRRWLWMTFLVLLGLSIAANFFLVGYIAHGLFGNGAAVTVLNNIASVYPPEVRQEFRNVMAENRFRTFAALRELRSARRDLSAAVSAQPFDTAAVEHAMKDVAAATSALQQTIQDYLLVALKRVKEKPPSPATPSRLAR